MQLSQESLFDFLQSTGLPLVSSLGSVLRRAALALGCVSVGFGLVALLLWPHALWDAALPWAGALPGFAAAPLYFVAWRLAGRQRMQGAALAFFAALFCVSALASWPRGAFNAAWYVEPILALLATCCLGVVPGLVLTLFAVTCVLTSPLARQETLDGALSSQLWAHAASLSALTLASALTGVLVHKVLLAALEAIESQRQQNRHSVRALRHREKLLRHALRVETVGDLAGLVTHQLRNAFQVMLGHVSLGAMNGVEDLARRLDLVGETLQRSRPLLDQLMSLAHPDEGVPEAGDLNAWAAAFFERAQRV